MIDHRTAPYGALVLRASLGVMFIAHGLYLKLVVFTLPGTVKFFESLGLPGFAAHATIAAEAIGGLLLIVGFQARAAALALVPLLLGATWVHWKNGWLFTNAGGGWEYPLFLAVAAVAVALTGPGAYALSPVRYSSGSKGGARWKEAATG